MAQQSAQVVQRCEEAKGSKELMLNSCDLRKFPDAVFFLMKEVELQKVSLAHNQLQKLPSKMGAKFATITSLDLSHNRLTTLPNGFSDLQSLTEISLSSNLFETLPEVLKQLPSLQSIDLSQNRLNVIQSSDLDAMQILESLDVTGNPLGDDTKVFLQSIVRIRINTGE